MTYAEQCAADLKRHEKVWGLGVKGGTPRATSDGGANHGLHIPKWRASILALDLTEWRTKKSIAAELSVWPQNIQATLYKLVRDGILESHQMKRPVSGGNVFEWRLKCTSKAQLEHG